MNTLKAYNNNIEIKNKHISLAVSNRILSEKKEILEENNCENLGIPKWLARVISLFYSNLPENEVKEWYIKVFNSIKPGVDLNKAEAPFVIHILESLSQNYDVNKYKDVDKAVKTCIDLYKRKNVTEQEWEAARSAARSAASAAWSAARSAAYAAYSAASAAWSAARSAAGAAESAANAAWSAARSAAESAARSEAYKKYADKLIDIIESLEVENE